MGVPALDEVKHGELRLGLGPKPLAVQQLAVTQLSVGTLMRGLRGASGGTAGHCHWLSADRPLGAVCSRKGVR